MKKNSLLSGLLILCFMMALSTGSRAGGSRLTITRMGWFYVKWGHRTSGSTPEAIIRYFLVDDSGNSTELQFDDKSSEGPLAFDRKRVQISGEQTNSSEGGIKVRSLTLAEPSSREVGTLETNAVIGNKKWVTILCRFADSTSVTPNNVGFFQGMMSNTAPGMDHYWRETSYGNINLAGSVVVGWYNLPRERSYYVYGNPLRVDFFRIETDAETVADADVYFPDFYGINFVFNQPLDGFSWGGVTYVSKDGLNERVFGAMDMSPDGYGNQSRVAHEMGHGFGLHHSSGPYSTPYDSQWDPMSSLGICSARDATYGCVGANTISYHKDLLGWIPLGRKYVAPPGSTATINIERLGQPSNNNYLMGQIPIGVLGTQFYTVEARLFAGYDGQIPGQAIVIHQVDPTRVDRTAQVVDADNNGNPNDEGAKWLPGEVFTDAANGIQVTINSMNATSFSVTIANSPPPILFLDETSGQAAALDSVSFVTQPFSITTPNNLSSDQRTRLLLFVGNLAPSDNLALIAAQAEDAQHRIYPLVVESAGRVPNFDWLTQLNVVLPDAIAHAGNVQVRISLQGRVSNQVVLSIR